MLAEIRAAFNRPDLHRTRAKREAIDEVLAIATAYEVKLYAIDFYLPKTLPLQVMLGIVKPNDPRYGWISISNPDVDFAAELGIKLEKTQDPTKMAEELLAKIRESTI